MCGPGRKVQEAGERREKAAEQDPPETERLKGRLAHAFTTHKKRVPCPSRVLCERAGLLEAVCRERECLALATLPFPSRRTAL